MIPNSQLSWQPISLQILQHVEVEKGHWLQIVTGFDEQLKEPVLATK